MADMEKEFFTTRNVITDLFTYLKNHDCVAIDRKFTLRGRGRYIYTFINRLAIFIEQDQLLSKAYKSNDFMVQKIIRNELQETTISLRSSHRLFILILVIHADQMGRISDISSSNIRHMMGNISTDRFKSQLRKLQFFKLLSSYIAGFTSKNLFGKVKSSYFINLNHPVFLDWRPETSSILIDVKSISSQGVNGCSEANALIETSKFQAPFRPVLLPIKRILKIEDIRYLFCNANVHDNLQLRLFDIASLILSEIWSNADIEIPDNDEDKETIHKIIDLFNGSKTLSMSTYELLKKIEISSNLHSISSIDSVVSNDGIKPEMSEKYRTLVYPLILLSLNIANRYKSILLKILGNECHIKEFCIIPKQKIKTECTEYEIRFIAPKYDKKRLNLSCIDHKLQGEKSVSYCSETELIKYIQPKFRFNHYHFID